MLVLTFDSARSGILSARMPRITAGDRMENEEAKRRFRGLPPDAQLRVLATFGHNLTIAARDTYEFQAPGVRAPQRLRDINEIQHRVLAHILALASVNKWRYPDDDLLSIVFELGDDHVRSQSLWALDDALQREA
jgi:hypothetical protein